MADHTKHVLLHYMEGGDCVLWFLCFKDTVLHIYAAISCLLIASEENLTVHNVIHTEDDSVKCSIEVQGRNIKNRILMRYADSCPQTGLPIPCHLHTLWPHKHQKCCSI